MRNTFIMFVGHAILGWASKLEHDLVIEEAKLEHKRKRIGATMALGQRLLYMSMPDFYPEPGPDSEARTH